jgi:pentatricopeptide repeat protein
VKELPSDTSSRPNFGFEGAPYIHKALGSARAGDWQAAEAVFEDLIHVAGSATAERLLTNMIANGIHPSDRCFNMLIHAYAREGYDDTAAHLLEEAMLHGKLPVPVIDKGPESLPSGGGSLDDPAGEACRNTAVQPWAKASDLRRAEEGRRKALRSGHEINEASYSSIAVGFHEAGLTAKAELWCRMGDIASRVSRFKPSFEDIHADDGLAPLPSCDGGTPDGPPGGSGRCYNTVVQALAKAGEPRCAEYWHRKALCSGHQINQASYSSLAFAFQEAGLTAEAKLWRRMGDIVSRVATFKLPSEDAHADETPPLSSFCYNLVVQAQANVGKPRRAEWWLRKALYSGTDITDETYSSIASAFREVGLTGQADFWCRLGGISSRVSSR